MHDGLFKNAFKDKEVAQDFLKSRLSPELLQRVDLDGVQLENPSFVDEELSQNHSDVVFSLPINGKKGYVYTLIEHQMTQDETMPIRLLEYNVKLMRQHLKMHPKSKLPNIINLVLYAGQKAYTSHRRIMDAFEDPALLSDMLSHDFLIDLNRESEDRIKQDGKAALAEIILRAGQRRDFCNFVDQQGAKLGVLIQQVNYGVSAMVYIFDRDSREPEEILDKIITLEPSTKKEIMRTATTLIERGREKGRQEGRQEGR